MVRNDIFLDFLLGTLLFFSKVKGLNGVFDKRSKIVIILDRFRNVLIKNLMIDGILGGIKRRVSGKQHLDGVGDNFICLLHELYAGQSRHQLVTDNYGDLFLLLDQLLHESQSFVRIAHKMGLDLDSIIVREQF